MNSRDRSKNWILEESGKSVSLSLRGLHRNPRTLSVIPNEREGSKISRCARNDKREWTRYFGDRDTTVRERGNSYAEGMRPCSN
jgi:hypothetical protein